jgi:hypothetical protein
MEAIKMITVYDHVHKKQYAIPPQSIDYYYFSQVPVGGPDDTLNLEVAVEGRHLWIPTNTTVALFLERYNFFIPLNMIDNYDKSSPKPLYTIYLNAYKIYMMMKDNGLTKIILSHHYSTFSEALSPGSYIYVSEDIDEITEKIEHLEGIRI